MGAWIETPIFDFPRVLSHIALCMEPWVEIGANRSLLFWDLVAPYVETCVEINVQNRIFVYCTSRFLYGSVSWNYKVGDITKYVLKRIIISMFLRVVPQLLIWEYVLKSDYIYAFVNQL